MSNSYTRDVKFWEDLERKLKANVSSRQNCVGIDVDTFVSVIIMTCMISLDLPSGVNVEKRRRDLQTWAHYVSKLHPAYVSKSYKSILLSIMRLSRKKRAITTYNHFKGDMLASGISDFSLITLHISEALHDFFNGSYWRITELNQMLVTFSRISLREVDFSQQCFSDYMHNERLLKEHKYDDTVLDCLNSIVKSWFSPEYPTFDVTVSGRHSSGSVSKGITPAYYRENINRPTVIQKYSQMGFDNFTSWIDPDLPIMTMKALDRTCQVIFVRKSTETWRTISMEPPTLMFYQKAVQISLYDWVENHPILKRCICFSSQETNHKRTYQGSLPWHKRYATIDLSSASDLLSWYAVARVFDGTPLYPYIIGVRSTHYRYKTHKGELQKHAPMGSAMCFPIMTMFLTACCSLALRMSHAADFYNCSVYGDDIIVPDDVALILISILESCALQVNERKSFIGYDIPFRESCGVEYYDGVDVTPFRFPREYYAFNFDVKKSTDVDPEAFASTIQVINTLESRGYKTARAYLIRRVMMLPQRLRPLFSSDGLGDTIKTPTPTNFHLKIEPDYKWYGMAITHGGITAKHVPCRNWEVLDFYSYYEWLRSTDGRHEVFEPCVVPRDGTRAVVKARVTIIT